MRRSLSNLFILFIFSLPAHGEEIWRSFFEALESNRIEEAESYMRFVREKEHKNLFAGLIHFYRGNYEEALSHLQSIKGEETKFYAELVSATYTVMKDAEVIETDHWHIRLTERDGILGNYIGEAAEEVYTDVGEIFGYYPQWKIRVEVYPDREGFSKATTLAEMEVMNTGTVGVCKFNKIMLLTPRILLQGYPWAKVLRHEYIHYIVTYLTRNRAPVWLQEAVARYFDGEGLPSYALYLLKKRMDEGRLISTEEMHPSIAKLPSAEDAAVAFAEVYTMMELFVEKKGKEGVLSLLNAVEAGEDALMAFERLLGMKFKDFQKEWMDYVRKKAEGIPPLEFERLVFKDEKEKEKRKGKHYVLGEVLLERKYIEEAAFEYEREMKTGTFSPELYNKIAFLYLMLGRYEDALNRSEEVLRYYPFNYTANFQKGKALNLLGKKEEAMKSLKNAAKINPFDPALQIEMERVKR